MITSEKTASPTAQPTTTHDSTAVGTDSRPHPGPVTRSLARAQDVPATPATSHAGQTRVHGASTAVATAPTAAATTVTRTARSQVSETGEGSAATGDVLETDLFENTQAATPTSSTPASTISAGVERRPSTRLRW